MRNMKLKVWNGEDIIVVTVMIEVHIVQDDLESMVCVGQEMRDEFVKLKYIRCKT